MSDKLPPVSEHDTQANFFKEANFEFRNDETFIPELFYAVLHGAWIAGSSPRAKGKLIAKYKDEGWKPGIPDIHYDQPRGLHNKLVIEFKRADRRNEKNGGLSDDQLDYMNAIAPYALVKVCYNEDEAMEALREYMALPDNIHPTRRAFQISLFHDQFNHDRETCGFCTNDGEMD